MSETIMDQERKPALAYVLDGMVWQHVPSPHGYYANQVYPVRRATRLERLFGVVLAKPAIRNPLPTENSKHDEPMSGQERAVLEGYISQIEARRQKLKPSTD